MNCLSQRTIHIRLNPSLNRHILGVKSSNSETQECQGTSGIRHQKNKVRVGQLITLSPNFRLHTKGRNILHQPDEFHLSRLGQKGNCRSRGEGNICHIGLFNSLRRTFTCGGYYRRSINRILGIKSITKLISSQH